MQKLMLLLGVCLGSYVCSVAASEDAQIINPPKLPPIKKIYIPFDKLCVIEEGMYVDLSGEFKPIDALYKDAQGYYIFLGKRKPCPCPKEYPDIAE